MYLSYSSNFATNKFINSSYISIMAALGFQYEPISLDVEQAVLKKNRISLIHVKIKKKSKCY